LVTFLAFTPLLSIASFFLAQYAFITSWTYLRFYKTAFPDLETNQSASLRGDASETFAFAEFFPDPIRAPVATLSDAVYSTLLTLHICTPFSADDVSASRGDPYRQSRNGAPGSSRAETERRRALALKELDQRLTAMSSQPSNMLGETNYVPEGETAGEKEGKGSNQD
jgi:hypothetical protein